MFNLSFVTPYSPSSLTLTAYIWWFSRLGPLKVQFCKRHCLIECYLWCRILKRQNIVKVGCPSNRYTAFRDSYLSTISNKLNLNPCNFNCCHSPRSQLYPLSKICKILQHTDNSVPRGHLRHARTRGVMNYLRRSHLLGLLWATHFSVFHMSGPES